jgi:pimeloyl-ACP methyl ester carboxylesterase
MKITSNGIALHVEDRGNGAPAVVFLHYWGGSSRTWRHVADLLSVDFRTVAMDQRGWGRSDKPDYGYDLASLAADVEGVVAALGLARFVLVGHSMGGKVAQLVASRRPPGLAGLILVAPSPPVTMNLPPDVRHGMVGAYASRDSIVATVEQVLAGSPLGADDLEAVVSDSLLGSAAARAAWPLATSQEDIGALVVGVAVPTLVISGEEDRVDPPAVLRQELLTRIPQAKFCLLPGIGHLVPLEAPDHLAGSIRTFIQSLEPAALAR